MRGLRLLAVATAAATVAGCAASAYIDYRVSPDYPRDRDETIAIPALRQVAKVYLDEAGVAHVDAADELDLAAAAGFFQARNRYFEMDMLRRFARGRMSELVGEQPILGGTTVDFDVSMRGWGMDRAVRGDVAAVDPSGRALLDAFTGGVNAALALYRPLEYRLLRVEPDPWTVEDCFAVGRLNAWGVTHNWQQELSRLLLALSVGLERAERIYPSDWWHGGTSLPPNVPARVLPPAVAPELADAFPPRLYVAPVAPKGHAGAALDAVAFARASNSWVVAGDRSASGKPVAANDPHLAHMLPSLFYPQHLRAPGVDVIGASIPGLPFVLAGHNENVAWGVTSAVADVVDLYVERLDPADPGRVLTPGGSVALARDEQVVRVMRDGKLEERRIAVRRSGHGPIMNDMYPRLFPPHAPLVSMRWDPAGVPASIAALSRLARSRTVEELREAALGITTPATVWTAADTSGSIALFVTGELPSRANHLGTFPAPGWKAEYEWGDPVDAHRMPHAVSREGFLAHANNIVRDPSASDVFVNVDAAPSYRFDRISERLAATSRHTAGTLAAVQMDVKLNRARRLVPAILADLESGAGWSAIEREAIALLRSWDFEATAGSTATAVFFTTYREAVVAALRDELDPAGFEFLLSQRYSTNVADLWFDAADHPVWDDRATPAPETRADVVRAAFRRAVARLVADLGPSPADWRWGRLHTLQIKHAFGGQKSLAGFVNLPVAEVGGGLDSVWKSHFDLGNEKAPFAAMAGPAYRHVVDLADIRHGLWVSDTGVSGWPGSPHYGDQHERWKRGEFFPMVSDWDDIRKGAKAVVTLVPASAVEGK